MKRFRFKLKMQHTEYCDVEAESESEARDIYCSGSGDYDRELDDHCIEDRLVSITDVEVE